MERELPIVDIDNHPFTIDVEKEEFRQVTMPCNSIRFDEMAYKGTHYELPYNRTHPNWIFELLEDESDYTTLLIPPIATLDPEGLSLKHGIPIDSVKTMSDFDIMFGDERYRKSKQLPEVSIAGHLFAVDFRNNVKMLRLQSDPSKTINIGPEQYNGRKGEHMFYFDTVNMNITTIDKNIQSLPDHIVLVEMSLGPDLRERSFGEVATEEEVLMRQRNMKETTVKTIHLSATSLVTLVNKNNPDGNIPWQKSTRELPLCTINDEPFVVDVEKEEFRQLTMPCNCISFNELKYTDAHYELFYNRSRPNIKHEFAYESDEYARLTIPHVTQLDPEGVSKKYHLPIEAVKAMTDFEVMVDLQWYDQRSAASPEIDIAGEIFDVAASWGKREVVCKADPNIQFELMNVWNERENMFRFFYDIQNKKPVAINDDIIALPPEHIVAVELLNDIPRSSPHPHGSENERAYIMHYRNRFGKNFKATITPIAATAVASLVKRNQLLQATKQIQLPGPKRSKGRGIH